MTDFPAYAELMRAQTKLMNENARLMEQMLALIGWVLAHDPDGLFGGRDIVDRIIEQDAMSLMGPSAVAHD
jgi:hypothetical protein